MTLLDVLVVVVVVIAAVAGFRSLGGTARAGGLIGLVVGAGVGATLGPWLTGLADGGASRQAFLLLGLALGMIGGALLGRWVGGLLSRLFHRGRLTIIDRVVGAFAGAGSALLVLWLFSWVPALVLGGAALEPVALLLDPLGSRSQILDGLGSALPETGRTVRDVVGPAIAVTR